MPRHKTITEQYLADLQACFRAEARKLRAARDGHTRAAGLAAACPYMIAMERAETGWSSGAIDRELIEALLSRGRIAA